MLSKLNRQLFLRNFSTINNSKINELKEELIFNFLQYNNISKFDTNVINKINNKYSNNNLLDDIAIISIIKSEYKNKLNCLEIDNKIKEFKIFDSKYKMQKDFIDYLNLKDNNNNNNNVNNELYQKIKYYYALFIVNKIN